MATKKLSFFEYLSSEGLFQISEAFSTLLLWGLFYIILLTLLSFAFIPSGDQFEYHELFLMEEGLIGWNTGYFSTPSFLSVFLPGIVALLLIFQYLRSHIGEKQPSDHLSELRISHLGVQTALFYSAVFCFSASVLFDGRNKRMIRFILDKK